MANREIRVGLVGLGFMAATHLKAYRKVPGVRVGALCNPSGRNLDGDFSKVFGNIGDAEPLRLDMSQVRAYRSYAELLADPQIDAVDLCTPTDTHRGMVLEALRAGKHVLCEKPLARTAAEAREMVAAAQASRAFLMPAMCVRFWPEYAWVRTAVVDGRFGKVRAARFRRVAEPPAWGQSFFLDGRRSGGALLDLHIHDADFVQYCFGPPARVHAAGYSQVSGAIDHVVAQYHYPGGPIVSAEGAWTMQPGFGFSATFTVNFERATVDFDGARGPEALRLYVAGQAPQTIRPEGGDGYVQELLYWTGCLREGRAPRTVTAEDALAVLALCEATERSIAQGATVAVP